MTCVQCGPAVVEEHLVQQSHLLALEATFMPYLYSGVGSRDRPSTIDARVGEIAKKIRRCPKHAKSSSTLG